MYIYIYIGLHIAYIYIYIYIYDHDILMTFFSLYYLLTQKKGNVVVHIHCRVVIRGFLIPLHIVQFIGIVTFLCWFLMHNIEILRRNSPTDLPTRVLADETYVVG